MWDGEDVLGLAVSEVWFEIDYFGIESNSLSLGHITIINFLLQL